MQFADPHGARGPLDDSGGMGPADDQGPCLSDEELVIEVADEPADPDLPNRLWLKAIVPLLQLQAEDAGPTGRTRFAFDQMYIAACERLSRIFRSDLDAPGH